MFQQWLAASLKWGKKCYFCVLFPVFVVVAFYVVKGVARSPRKQEKPADSVAKGTIGRELEADSIATGKYRPC